METGHEVSRTRAEYADVVAECRENGWSIRLYPVEVGARGSVGSCPSCLLKDLRLQRARLIKSPKSSQKPKK